MPLISIITSVYNAREQLPLCIQSILSQTITDFELILVEDGSPNGCGEICDEWAKKDSRIRVIHKKNGGPASASNAGLDTALGKYIGFVDSDDIIEPNFYEVLYNALIKNGCQIAACGAEGIDENGNPLPDITVQSCFEGKISSLDMFYDIFKTGTMYGMLSWNKLFDASLFKCRGIRYDEKMLFGDDASILHLVYDHTSTYCLNDKLYHYRTRAGSITSAAFPWRKLDDLTMYWDWLCWFQERQELSDLYQWSIACYWRVFYIFYCMASDCGSINEQKTKDGFAYHMKHLKMLKAQIETCPYISDFEKKRYGLFCLSPRFAYTAAKIYGKLSVKHK